MLVIPPGFGLLSYNFTLLGDPEPMFTTIGVDVAFGAVGPQDKVNQKADAWMNATTTAQIAAGYTFIGCTIRATQGPLTAGGVYEAPRSKAGTGGAVALPNNCSLLYKKFTARAGRNGRGRMFIPPYIGGEGVIDQTGVITESVRLSIEDYLGLAMPGDDFVLLHSQPPVGPALPPDPITGFALDRRIATQRRRLR
jgi:hypothetical protein